MRRKIFAFALGLALANAGAAQAFEDVTDQGSFLSLVEGKTLTKLGISLDVDSAGGITGRAFGRAVSGRWWWDDQYFCRSLSYGGEDLGENCQQVLVNGRTVRFVADRGTGEMADLNLR